MHLFRKLIPLLALLLALPASAATLPLTDNTAPPFLGVWEPMYQGTGATDNFAKWLNRKALYPVITQYVLDATGWPAVFDKYWVDPQWGKWVAEVPGRQAVIIVSLTVDSDSLEKGALGRFDDKATAVANYLVSVGLGNCIVCMGMINTPADWDALSATDVANFVLYWQEIVKSMRAVPGAEKIQFDWVGMNRKMKFPIESAYPGDAYVDYVGMFLYDQCLDKSIYPLPADATDDQKLERQKKAWNTYYLPASENGLEAWRNVAKAHRKPFSIPLWCLYSDHYDDGTLSTGGDNAFFIQQMHDYIQDPANNVAFHCYMDNYPVCTRISPPGPKDPPAFYPNSTALFEKLFALPAATPPANPSP